MTVGWFDVWQRRRTCQEQWLHGVSPPTLAGMITKSRYQVDYSRQ